MNERPEARSEEVQSELYRDRWTSFGGRTGILGISERLSPAALREFEIFAPYDDAFLELISPDISVARWQAGTVLFEEGTYIDLAFYIAAGRVEIYLGSTASRLPIFDDGRTGYIPTMPPAKAEPETAPAQDILAALDAKGRASPEAESVRPQGITFLSTMDFDLAPGDIHPLAAGDLFGEIGAMSGWPQSVTVRTVTDCSLVQIRLPALRKMRFRSADLKERLDRIYRRQSLSDQLRATPLFRDLGTLAIEALTEAVELVSCEPNQEITREGEEVDALYMVRSGFVKLNQRFGQDQLVVNYLSKGMTLGEAELLVEDTGGWTVTATSMEYAELVRLPRPMLSNLLQRFPEVEKRLWSFAVSRLREAGFGRRNMGRSELTQTALDNGLVQGNSILVIDLDTCTRCDDCVRACATTHEGIPRFVREGEKYANLQIVNACYHCRDPVCLVGCPTGAIRRTGVGHVVAIDENICIGCQTCARSCPYDAIVMHGTGEEWPEDNAPPRMAGSERMIASKCDLCYTSEQGPACVKSCPNGCAYRIGSLEEFEELLSRP